MIRSDGREHKAMRVLLVGVSCVGKTIIGRLLADRLGCRFFDLDEETEKHFGDSIERIQSKFMTARSYRYEVSQVLKRLALENESCVIALPPSGLRDELLRAIRKIECVTVVIEDAPRNILNRITFYDVDSKPIRKVLSDKERAYYEDDIRKDISFFNTSYRLADLHADITGLDAAASAELIENLLAERSSSGKGESSG